MFNDFTFNPPKEMVFDHRRRGSVDLDPLFKKRSRDYSYKFSDSTYPKFDLDDVSRIERDYEQRKLSTTSSHPSSPDSGWISTSSKSGVQYCFVTLFPPSSIELLNKYSKSEVGRRSTS